MNLPASVHYWPPAAKEEYEERAAIAEFDGKLSSRDAERLAEQLIRQAWAQKERQVHDQSDTTRSAVHVATGRRPMEGRSVAVETDRVPLSDSRLMQKERQTA